MINYDSYKGSLNWAEQERLDQIQDTENGKKLNLSDNQSTDVGKILNDAWEALSNSNSGEIIEFAGISFDGKDEENGNRSIIKLKGIDKLLVDDRTVVGNITENLEDRKYIAINDNNVEQVQELLKDNNITFDGPYESSYDAFVLDTVIDNVNHAAVKNNKKLSWTEKAGLINSQRMDVLNNQEDYIMMDVMKDSTNIAVQEGIETYRSDLEISTFYN